MADEIATQFSVVEETPSPYFSRTEFLTGIGYEIEKLIVFTSHICKNEQVVNASLKYISELKNLGIYC